MEENNKIKIAHTTNLPTLNIKAQLNMNIDSNTIVKQVLNIDACLIDVQIEAMNGKALLKGVIGIKAMYLDADNMFNSLADTINFSETINSDMINADCQISIGNNQFIAEFDNDDKTLRINIDGTIDCFCNSNTSLILFTPTSDSLVTKKSVFSACSCIQKINKTTNYDFDFKLDVKINKMLSCDSKIIVEESKCYEGYVLLTGQIINNLIYEVENNGTNCIKLYNNSTPFKCEVEAKNCDNDCVADLFAYINLNSTQITTDINDSNTKFDFEYAIIVNGCLYKDINVDIVEDIYSLDTAIETLNNTYDVCKKLPYFKSTESIDTEITLADELNVDEILGMVNTNSSVTQYSIKDNMVVIEGVVNGNLLYLDENRDINHLPTQVPYSISIKQELKNEVCGVNISVVPINCKCKIKRGNTLIIDYELLVNGTIYTKTQVKLIDSIKYGKKIEYGDIAFQIYIARSNESSWDLCKRLNISQEQLIQFNNDLPQTYLGGEKIIVYR